MANQQYTRASGRGKFAYTGMDLRNPPDLLPPGKAQLLLNVTAESPIGAITQRPGLVQFAPSAAATAIHSYIALYFVFALANQVRRYAGSGANLYVAEDATGFATTVDTGYSGNPLSFVTSKPYSWPEAFLYVSDSTRARKIRPVDGGVSMHGILPPVYPPDTFSPGPLSILLVDSNASGAWASSSSLASTPTTVARLPVNTTVINIAYERSGGAPSFATIQPANSGNWLGTGVVLTSGSGSSAQFLTVAQVFPSLSQTAVQAVVADPTMPGVYIIAPYDTPQGLQRHALILVGGVATRVLSVTEGPDGRYSLRCALPSIPALTTAITIPPSFRTYAASPVAIGSALTSQVYSTVVSGAGSVIAYGAYINDLTTTAGQRLTSQDYMHVSLWIDNPNNLQEIHVLLDCDATTNNFTQNYFYYVAQQSALQSVGSGTSNITAALLNTLTSNLAASQPTGQSSAQPDYPAGSLPSYGGATSIDQLPTGGGQWFEALFTYNDLTRVGSDTTVGMSTIKTIGIQVIATGACTVRFGSWWVGGTGGPDANWNSYGNQGQPILYRYRYRSSVTGAHSDVSPPTRNGELPKRNSVDVYVTPSTDPQVDLIDIERFGGTNNSWHQIGTLENNATPPLFWRDSMEEAMAANTDSLDLLQYAPWPISDLPKLGYCNVVGTLVTWVSGDTFNPNWIRGNLINLYGRYFTLAAPPYSTTMLEVVENVGNFTNQIFSLSEPTIIGQPLPYMAGIWDGRIWATGDTLNPGLLYFSNQNNPDTASDQGYIEVTDPNEPLGPPILFEAVLYVASPNHMYRVESTPSSLNLYTPYRIPAAPGLVAPWAYNNAGPLLVWLGKDGIYAMGGGLTVESLTEGDLAPLFPNQSRPGLPVSVAGVSLYPPDFTAQTALRIGFADNHYYFDYQDTQGARNTLVYSLLTKGWILRQYTPAITLHVQEPKPLPSPTGAAANEAYTICGAVDGSINTLGNTTTDKGTAFSCAVVTPADDSGETRARKQYGDLMLDYGKTA